MWPRYCVQRNDFFKNILMQACLISVGFISFCNIFDVILKCNWLQYVPVIGYSIVTMYMYSQHCQYSLATTGSCLLLMC